MNLKKADRLFVSSAPHCGPEFGSKLSSNFGPDLRPGLTLV